MKNQGQNCVTYVCEQLVATKNWAFVKIEN